MARLDELLLQGGEVLDDAVVHHGEIVRARGVGVGILLRGAAVGGPASVADAADSLGEAAGDRILEVCHLAHPMGEVQPLPVLDGHAGGVVPAVLHSLQT